MTSSACLCIRNWGKMSEAACDVIRPRAPSVRVTCVWVSLPPCGEAMYDVDFPAVAGPNVVPLLFICSSSLAISVHVVTRVGIQLGDQA